MNNDSGQMTVVSDQKTPTGQYDARLPEQAICGVENCGARATVHVRNRGVFCVRCWDEIESLQRMYRRDDAHMVEPSGEWDAPTVFLSLCVFAGLVYVGFKFGEAAIEWLRAGGWNPWGS